MTKKIEAAVARSIIEDRDEIIDNSTSAELLMHCALVATQAEQFFNELITDVVNLTLEKSRQHDDEDEFKEALLKAINASDNTQTVGGMMELLRDSLVQVCDSIIEAHKAGKLNITSENKTVIRTN